MYPFNTSQVLKMCMKKFNDEKIIFDKFTAVLTEPIFDHFTYRIMANSS